jgi:hypothetical protein
MTSIRLCITGVLSLAAVAFALLPPAEAAKKKKEPAASAAKQSDNSGTESLGSSGPWSAYASRDKTGPVCYMVGEPQKTESAGTSRKLIAAMVTHRPSENVANVVSFVEGYPLKEGSEVELQIDGKKFDLFTNDDSAWARTAELDRTIVTLLARGRTATVKGTPQKGKPTTDTYSLTGFTKVLGLIDKACGIKRDDGPAHAEPKPRHQKKAHRAKH